MKIWVSSLALAPRIAAQTRASRAVSLLSPGDLFPSFDHLQEDDHHRVHLHDIVEPMDGCVTPARGHVEDLVTFLGGWDPGEMLLIHCWAGISRSTATAFIAACLHNPDADERDVAAALREASPTAYPNPRIVGFADEILGRDGRMRAAAASIGRGEIALEAEPFHIPARFQRRAGAAGEKGR
jgi:predicted protein tyrosine phosphatase